MRLTPKYLHQLKVTQEVAANFWDQDITHLDKALSSIKVLNRTGSKIVCLLPEYESYPQCICKVYFSGQGFQNELKGYQAAQSFKPIENISVPAIIKFLPEKNAIITEKRSLRDSRLDLLKCLNVNQTISWQNVGRWLKNFHDSQVSSSPNDQFLEKKFDRLYQHLKKYGDLFTADEVSRIKKVVSSAQSFIGGHAQEWVISHGDFGLGNIKTSRATTYVIDFENVTMTPRGYEMVKFLSGLQSTIYFLFRENRYESLAQAVLNGYGTMIEPNTLNIFFYLLTKIDMIAKYSQHIAAPGLRIDKPFYALMRKSLIASLPQWLEHVEDQIVFSYQPA